jgi:tetratricopeptide (TPR) repeat protein
MPPGSGDYSIHRNSALALELMGRYEDALRELDAALVAKPDDHEVHLARAVVHFKLRDIPHALDALRVYRTSPKVKKPSARYYAYTVLASAVGGDLDYAVAVGREGMTLYADSAPILVNLAAVMERRGELDAAAALYKRATALTPSSPPAPTRLGDLGGAHGDMQGAQAQYEKAVKLAPRIGDDVYLRLGTLAYKGNDRDMAKLLWRRAIDLNPHNEAVKANLEMFAGE